MSSYENSEVFLNFVLNLMNFLGGINEPVKLSKADGTTYDAVYHPKKEGRYVVMVTFGDAEVPKSPFEVNVGPYKETAIRAYGPGLVGGVVAYPALFIVETKGETGSLGKITHSI